MTRKKVLIGAAVVLAIVLAVGMAVRWFLADDAPEEVSLSAAVESVTSTESIDTTTTTTGPDTGESSVPPTTIAPAPTPIGGIEGTWTIDAATGEFDFESATGSFVGFRIEEELATVGSTTAVGRTGGVSGTLTIEGDTVTSATIEVDMASITTDRSRRDDRVHDALGTDRFPRATFELTEPIALGDGAAAGEPVEATAVGELTIRGVTNVVELPIESQLAGSAVVVVGSLDIVFEDYGVEVPASQVVLSVEDHGIVEMQLLFVPS